MALFVIFIIVINLVSFSMMGIDKWKAKKKRWRISEKALFAVALFGGSIGAILGMYLFHHKTRHWYFVWGMPVILLLQLVMAEINIKKFAVF